MRADRAGARRTKSPSGVADAGGGHAEGAKAADHDGEPHYVDSKHAALLPDLLPSAQRDRSAGIYWRDGVNVAFTVAARTSDLVCGRRWDPFRAALLRPVTVTRQ